MSNSINNNTSPAEKSALAVSYDVYGTHVELDMDFVTKYLVRGRPELVTPQEIVFFMNTCKSQNLNPLSNGEVYLIKYKSDAPAQMVIGKDTYLRRASMNPDYLYKQEGITVRRGNQIVQKEGTCLYPNEALIGGWCRVYFRKGGEERSTFKEVALSEYSSGMSSWRTKPATMIAKVAVSQCVRDAFPRDYLGLYAEDELVASGAIPVDTQFLSTDDDEKPKRIRKKATTPTTETVVAEEQPVISRAQRQELFRLANELFGQKANDTLKELLHARNITNTAELTDKLYNEVIDEMTEKAKAQYTDQPIIEVETAEKKEEPVTY